jgi:hypothetical protein
MAMQIYGNYDYSQTNYAEKVKEKQVAERAEKVKQADNATDVKGADKLSEPQDEYISSEKSGKKPNGLYRIGQDENGNRKIFFDDPNKSGRADGKKEPEVDEDRSKEAADGKEPKVGGNNQGKPEKCVGNNDKVEQEIRKLKEKKQQLEQQMQSASGDEKKIQELEKKLRQVEQELSQKDNDSYRRQHTVFS